ncbi:hypothetical protein C8R42DRAFT_414754 [Lentinula raphanica]|nr:hypothetical protein C8R42DRAFT_414754 [Lentinula raphanica]
MTIPRDSSASGLIPDKPNTPQASVKVNDVGSEGRDALFIKACVSAPKDGLEILRVYVTKRLLPSFPRSNDSETFRPEDIHNIHTRITQDQPCGKRSNFPPTICIELVDQCLLSTAAADIALPGFISRLSSVAIAQGSNHEYPGGRQRTAMIFRRQVPCEKGLGGAGPGTSVL